jgi:hypothetical protein
MSTQQLYLHLAKLDEIFTPHLQNAEKYAEKY